VGEKQQLGAGRMWLILMLAGAVAAVALTAGSSGAASGPGVSAVYSPSGTDWTTSDGDLANMRYSTLDQINTSNVAKLKVAWTRSIDTPEMLGPKGAFQGIESIPIESAGVLYVATPNGVAALDAVTGKVKWTYIGTAPLSKACFAGGLFCIGSSANASRDISMGEGMVFAGQQDGSIVAVNQKTGTEVWRAQVAAIGTTSGTVKETNPWTMYANGVVLTSINGGDSPIQGHVDAYNAKTGAFLWRWFTTPDPTSLPFILSWSNPAEAATGGAAVWVKPAIDTKLNRVYFVTGNAHANLSPGKNLWSASIVSLDLKTGKLMWFFQGIHHDLWDYDCSTPPLLFNATVGGKAVPAIAATCKPGYIFLFDRRNGRQIFPIKEVPVPNPGNQPLGTAWPTQPQTTGGSAEVLNHCPTAAQVAAATHDAPAPRGTAYLPTCQFGVPNPGYTEVWGASASGGADFMPMSLDPQTGNLFVCANGSFYGAGGNFPTGGVAGYVSALNITTNKLAWRLDWQADKQGTCFSGVLSTAGGLVFAGSMGQPAVASTAALVPNPFGGTFFAYDSKTGKQLFSYPNTSVINAPAITYEVRGKQYVAVDMTAQVDYNSTFGASALADRLTVFTLGAGVATKPSKTTTTTTTPGGPKTKPPATETLVGDPTAGGTVFASSGCGSCHTLAAAGSKGTAGPNLDATAPNQAAIVQTVTNGGFNMPSFGGKLTSTQIKDVAAYVYKSTHA
jgi:PQQ-dependent dehydrogenase (methanol/ethanol family)